MHLRVTKDVAFRGDGDEIKIHAWGLTHTDGVRESKLLRPNRVSTVMQHEEYAWITLVTCEYYNPFSKNNMVRRMVMAVLLDVSLE
jgi:sortase (surface protein transpeptidase)